MAHPDPSANQVVLTDLERETLERWSRRPTSAQSLAMRCRIVLAWAEGGNNPEVGAKLGLNRHTVGKWRNRFIVHRLDGLNDEPGRERRAASATTPSRPSSSRPSKRRRPMPRTGRRGPWPRPRA